MLAVLNRTPAQRVPCAPHWWGSYKYEVQGLDPHRDCWRDGEGLAPVYTGFYERFRPDWFHLAIGTPRWFRDARIEPGDGGPVLAVEPRFRALKAEDRYFCFRSADDERVVDFADLILGSRAGRPKADLRSLSAVDAYVRDRIHMGAGLIEELGYTDHVRRIAAGYGDEALVIVNLPSPVCEIFDPLTGYLGFEAGLLAIHDHPEGLLRLLERCYESHLEWARAYARAGAHAFVVSESFLLPGPGRAGGLPPVPQGPAPRLLPRDRELRPDPHLLFPGRREPAAGRPGGDRHPRPAGGGRQKDLPVGGGGDLAAPGRPPGAVRQPGLDRRAAGRDARAGPRRGQAAARPGALRVRGGQRQPDHSGHAAGKPAGHGPGLPGTAAEGGKS